MLHEYSAGQAAAELWQLQHRLQAVMRHTTYLSERDRIGLTSTSAHFGRLARRLHDIQMDMDEALAVARRKAANRA